MDFKKIFWISIFSFILLYLFALISSIFFEVNFSSASDTSNLFWFFELLFSVILGVIFSVLYFDSKKTSINIREGFFFGVSIIIISFIVEFLLIVPYILIVNNPLDIISYFFEPLFWMSVLLFLVSTSLVGFLKSDISENNNYGSMNSYLKKKANTSKKKKQKITIKKKKK